MSAKRLTESTDPILSKNSCYTICIPRNELLFWIDDDDDDDDDDDLLE